MEVSELKKDFTKYIKERGKKYYDGGKVQTCYKDHNNVVSKVKGSKLYIINVDLDKNIMSCSCSCEFTCKHEYATLLALQNDEYKEVSLKNKILKKEITLQNLIKKIPSNDLKKYILLNTNSNSFNINYSDLEDKFIKYLPKQEYAYYYNNLYNYYVLENNSHLAESFIRIASNYTDCKMYSNAFKVLKAIIEVNKELNNKTYEDMEIVGMLIKTIERRSPPNLKLTLKDYIKKMPKNYFKNTK